MTTFDIHTFYRSYVAALNAREFDRIDQFVADEVAVGREVYARDVVVGALESIIDAVPDFRWSVQELLVDGNRAAARLVNTGTPVKEWNGIEPTGASFEIVEYAIYRVDNGRFVEMMNLHDSAAAARQLQTT